jgi:hypothetical protein
MITITKHDRITRCHEAQGNLRCEFVAVRVSAAYFPQRICVHCGRLQERFAARWLERLEVNR